jgi:hypothetical protein
VRYSSDFRIALTEYTAAITAPFLKTYFFKLASDVSGVELVKLECMKAHRDAYGERMTEAQERQNYLIFEGGTY